MIKKKKSKRISFYFTTLIIIIFIFIYFKTLFLSIVLIVFIISFVTAVVWFRKDLKDKLKDKNFLIETLIRVFLFGVVFFFITWILNILVLTPFFSPNIVIDATCKYRTPLGQYGINLENRGKIGEEGFTMIIEDITLLNSTKYVYSTTFGEAVAIIKKENISAYRFSEEWAKDFCSIETFYSITQKDAMFDSPPPWYGNPDIKIYCKYFPPKSKTNIRLNFVKSDRNLDYVYFGKDTKVTRKTIKCKPPICMSRFKDFYLDVYLKLIKKNQYRVCYDVFGEYNKFFGTENPKY